MNETIIHTQEEMDKVPLDTKDKIIIKDTKEIICVKNKYYYRVEAQGNASVEAWNNASVVARNNASVEAWDNASVEAWNNASVEAWDNASVEAWNNASVEAWNNASVVARNNASVVARNNASVVAWNNASVVARHNASVEAQGNVQIVDRSQNHDIKTKGNARIVYMPQNINDFMVFYGIEHTKTKATFYKAVNKVNGQYLSNWNSDFIYEIGKTKEEKCDDDITEDCSYGIHISHLQWALDFGKGLEDLAILEVETSIKNIVLPEDSDGKVRTSKIKVIREVPLNECGLYGKIIEKRRNANL